MMNKIGFMQGRLSDQVEGKIQAFPWRDWKNEFRVAERLGIRVMEWTLDQERLYENPLMTNAGRISIRELSRQYQLKIPSLTGDCFMQAPFWKAHGKTKSNLKEDFQAICHSCIDVGIGIIVVPLVDAGRLETRAQENELVEFMLTNERFFALNGIQVVFESDFEPQNLRRFIDRLPSKCFGINYDIGNSAAMGFDPIVEFAEYGLRIVNVHIKDRELGGTTVQLEKGAAQFEVVFNELRIINYRGNYILQTARAIDGKHADLINDYFTMVENWIGATEYIDHRKMLK